jgi:SAM-dependent methyltransferase
MIPVKGGAGRKAPTFSNVSDCSRFGCRATPWGWATRWALERANLSGIETVCDLGAGQNPIALHAYQTKTTRAYLIDAIDFSLGHDEGESIIRITADLCRIPLEDESIDTAISISVLEHLRPAQRKDALREVERILRPGGKAVITMGNFLHVSQEAERKMAEMPFFTDRGCSVFFPIDLRDLLESATCLRLSSDEDLDYLPGFAKYDAEALSRDPSLCFEHFWDNAALCGDVDLREVVAFEIGLQLNKSGQG